jgi:hypothetical protein
MMPVVFAVTPPSSASSNPLAITALTYIPKTGESPVKSIFAFCVGPGEGEVMEPEKRN